MTMTRVRTRTARRARQWAITQNSTTLAGAAHSDNAVIQLQSGLETELAFNLHNVTASAIRMTLDFHYLVGSTIGVLNRVVFGIIWASDDSIAAGAASVPSPADDNADWMAFGGGSFISESVVAHSPRDSRFVISNDSMRKQYENNSSLVLVVSSPSFVDGIGLHIVGRILFILP